MMWLILCAIAYVLVIPVACGVLVDITGVDMNSEYQFVEQWSCFLGSIVWPIPLLFGLMIGLSFIVIYTLELIVSLVKINRLFTWLYRLGGGR